jgi:hypothetical protein
LEIHAQALIPQLGAEKGMIVVNRLDELGGVESELVNTGYGYSVLDEISPLEDYKLDSYVGMFSDWGWGLREEEKPAWMNRGPSSCEVRWI